MLKKLKFSRPWLLALLFILGMSAGLGVVAYSRMLRGDIDIASAGDLPLRSMPAPLDPSVKFAYDCQLQLNDWNENRARTIPYKGAAQPYELFAVACVTLDQDHRAVASDQLRWKWIAAIAGEEEESHIEIPLASPPADAFSTNGHSLALSGYQNEEGKPLGISLLGTVTLPIGNYFHFANGSARGTLESGPLEFYADAKLARKGVANPRGEPDALARRLYVECVRKK